jgi:hypothetical protein
MDINLLLQKSARILKLVFLCKAQFFYLREAHKFKCSGKYVALREVQCAVQDIT